MAGGLINYEPSYAMMMAITAYLACHDTSTSTNADHRRLRDDDANHEDVGSAIGFENIDVCHDGETALQMLLSQRYAFVLCDLEMQPVSGADFVRRARADPNGSQCIILLTTASRESAAKAVRDGLHLLADGIILKPFNSEDLRAKLLEIADIEQGRRRTF